MLDSRKRAWRKEGGGEGEGGGGGGDLDLAFHLLADVTLMGRKLINA